jgi:hypothetical protein
MERPRNKPQLTAGSTRFPAIRCQCAEKSIGSRHPFYMIWLPNLHILSIPGGFRCKMERGGIWKEEFEMAQLIYHVAATLDLFIADPDGVADESVFLYADDGGDFFESVRSYDAVLMGRKTIRIPVRAEAG